MDAFSEFEWRGLLQDHTEGAREALAEEPRVCYIGFDPTAKSLHVGSLLPIMGLVHLQRAGHTPIALVGGGTGLIGDPSGKTQERQLLTRELALENAEGIRAQLAHFLDFDPSTPNAARLLNNLDWLGELSLVDFLRDIGKHFSVNMMMAKESVKRRLQDEESGLSYTEFSYMLLQSYDFLELYQRENCTFQFGGSDQWGNITSGTDLIRRVVGGKAWGGVFPLVAASNGVKFGKTEAGTIWLDPDLTSPYRFYQFWLNTDDRDVVKYLKFFTLMSREEIAGLEAAHHEAPYKRVAHRALAEDVTRRVHGQEALDRAQQATQVLFGGSLEGLTGEEIADIFADVPAGDVGTEALTGEGVLLVELLGDSGVLKSRGEARRSIEQGGVYLNGDRVEDAQARVSTADAIEGRFLVFRIGKKRYHLLRVQPFRD
jgi:tyrosyl-tRNA synthetase